MRSSSKKVLLLIAAGSAISSGLATARADTIVTWANTSGSGNWSDPTQWNPQVSPNGAYAVTLPTGSETVTLDVSPTIDTLTVGNGVVLQTSGSNSSLTTGSLNNNGGEIIYQSGQSFAVNGTLTNYGSFNVGKGSTLTVTGDVVNNELFNSGYAGGATHLMVTGTFYNVGDSSNPFDVSSGVATMNALTNSKIIGTSAGTLLGVGSGTFSASEGFEELGDGTYDETIDASNANGVINVNGSVDLGGTLVVTLANGFVPSLGESFLLIDGTPGDLSGEFSGIDGQPFAGGEWQVTEAESTGDVTLTAIVPEPATIGLLGFATTTLLLRRRRSRA
jgi:hypothetical protein